MHSVFLFEFYGIRLINSLTWPNSGLGSINCFPPRQSKECRCNDDCSDYQKWCNTGEYPNLCDCLLAFTIAFNKDI